MSIASSSHQTNQLSDLVGSTVRGRIVDYAELCRPRIAVMTMVAVVVGFTLASPIVFNSLTLMLAVIGVVMLVAASSILNQCLEQGTDSGYWMLQPA